MYVRVELNLILAPSIYRSLLWFAKKDRSVPKEPLRRKNKHHGVKLWLLELSIAYSPTPLKIHMSPGIW